MNRQASRLIKLIKSAPPMASMQTHGYFDPHIIKPSYLRSNNMFLYPLSGECHIQPAEPEALGLMSQGSDYSLAIFLYPCDKDWLEREDRVASLIKISRALENQAFNLISTGARIPILSFSRHSPIKYIIMLRLHTMPWNPLSYSHHSKPSESTS